MEKTIFDWAELFKEEITQGGGSESNVVQLLEDYKKEIQEQLSLTDVSQQRELLIAFHKWQQKMWTNPNSEITENVVDVYLKSNL